MMTKKIIYFICTGNHAVAKWLKAGVKNLRDEWQVYSGGIEAHGVNQKQSKL